MTNSGELAHLALWALLQVGEFSPRNSENPVNPKIGKIGVLTFSIFQE